MRSLEYWNYLDRPETFVAYGVACVVLSLPADSPVKYRRLRRRSWPNARGAPFLVYKRFGGCSALETIEHDKAYLPH